MDKFIDACNRWKPCWQNALAVMVDNADCACLSNKESEFELYVELIAEMCEHLDYHSCDTLVDPRVAFTPKTDCSSARAELEVLASVIASRSSLTWEIALVVFDEQYHTSGKSDGGKVKVEFD